MTVVLTVGFVLAAQWSGVVVGPIQVSDILLGLVLLGLALGPRPDARGITALPWGIALILGAIALTTLINVAFPSDPGYVTRRWTLESVGGSFTPATRGGLGDAGLDAWAFTVKLALATLAGWLLLRRLHTVRPATATRLVIGAWLAGAIASGVVAILEWRVGLSLGAWVAHPIDQHRASGLAFHPNALALYSACSIPLTAIPIRRRPAVGAAALIVLWGAVLAADSRIGLAVAGVATLILPALLARGARAAVSGLAVAAVAAPAAVLAAAWVTAHTRLAAGSGARSDYGRRMSNAQAVLDWHHSPVWGIGFANAGGGVSAPLALLAAGGVIGLAGWVGFWAWGVTRGMSALNDLNVRALLASSACVAVVIVWQNNLTDRAQYLPLMASVLAAQARLGPRSRG